MFDLNTYSLSDFGRDILIALVVDAISNTILKALGAFDEIDNGSRIIILVFILIVVFSILALTRLFFGHTSFRWNHYHPVDDHQFELASCSATHKEKLSTKSKDGFQNCICGDFDWSDVDVQKVILNADNAHMLLSYTNSEGANVETEQNNSINIEEKIRNADYRIKFEDAPRDIQLTIHMQYQKEKMHPEYYVEVTRPIKKLIIRLVVSNDVHIHDVKMKIIALYGDKPDIYSKELKPDRKYSEPGKTSYTIVQHYPKILHQYKIEWKWTGIENSLS